MLVDPYVVRGCRSVRDDVALLVTRAFCDVFVFVCMGVYVHDRYLPDAPGVGQQGAEQHGVVSLVVGLGEVVSLDAFD